MSKKRSWLCLIKKFFFPEVHHQQKCKRRRWMFGRVKRTKGLPPPAVEVVQPETPITEVKKLDHGAEKQSNYEEYVPVSFSECEREVPNYTDVERNEARIISLNAQLHNHLENIATIKIQTIFRGYLARKALRALKGFVILQAVIRGRTVRRQAVTTLKCLQTIVSIQSQMCKRRELSQGSFKHLHLITDRNEKPKLQINREKRMDGGLLSKDEEIDFILRKKEAFLRKERTRALSFNHRNSADSDDRNPDGRLKYWLEQYVSDKRDKKDDIIGGKQLKMRNTEDLDTRNIITVPRRSLQNHHKRNSCSEDTLRPSSPTSFPAYMAATKSAKAKTRSLSTPRLRPVHFDSYSDGEYSPYKHKLSPMSSINSELTSSTFSKVSNRSCYSTSQQKSPSLKSVLGPIRSIRNLHNTRLDSKDMPLNRG